MDDQRELRLLVEDLMADWVRLQRIGANRPVFSDDRKAWREELNALKAKIEAGFSRLSQLTGASSVVL